MPLNISVKLPAVDILRKENIFVMDSDRASSQEIRPLKIVILNLMPLKITTETDLIRLLSNSPLQIEIDFMQMESHTSKNTPIEHMTAFYKKFRQVKKQNYDGMIITGAPVEQLDFEEVRYWNELEKIFDWAHTHVTSTLFICWAAQAGLYHYYKIPKYPLPEKMFGVFKHTVNDPLNPIFRGFDDEFFVPHSRHTEIRAEDIRKNPELSILSESPESGVYIVMARNGREFFITGHSEYSVNTLDAEYKRDAAKGLSINIPRNYYRGDNPENAPVVRWKSHANMLFTNWLNYFVYQETPYDLRTIR
ncbi:MAG: homoserine O-succinyltransferase [Prevotellaceae bacterium]|jgi:homoserine O-succinyltransferase|nr:homoserine O-succinyltransferase [Prevotellaceae bacterium]